MRTIETDLAPGRKRNRPLKDYTGQTFGRLTAVEFLQRDPRWGDHKWRFRCECGNETVTGIKQARGGHTSSCGCLFREVMVKRNQKHGMTKTHPREYRTWKDMRGRCHNENDSDYHLYGGRGIAICRRWDDFASFVEDMGERPARATLDRIDVNGDYEPGNCRWATADVQANNKRSNRMITYKGETKTLQQWCGVFGLDHSKVRYRLSRGKPLDEVFSLGDLRIGS